MKLPSRHALRVGLILAFALAAVVPATLRRLLGGDLSREAAVRTTVVALAFLLVVSGRAATLWRAPERLDPRRRPPEAP